jgi:hypothetical protein
MSALNSASDQQRGADGGEQRMEDAIYQNGQVVGRVSEVEIVAESQEIRFGEIYDSDYLLLPDECEFRNFRIMIRKIGYATRTEKQSPHAGRILKSVVAEILGYREQ